MAVTLLVCASGAILLAVVFWLWGLLTDKSQQSTVPGLRPSSNRTGNLEDIGKAGSLHEFLMGLHKNYGPIASFWWGPRYTVSIASPDLFKQHRHLSVRPLEFFEMFKPMFREESFFYSNGDYGMSARAAFDKVLTFEYMGIYCDRVQKVADEVAAQWNEAESDDHLPLGKTMLVYAAKAALVSLMGDTFADDKMAVQFQHNYNLAWNELEQRLTDPTPPEETSDRGRNFQNALDNLREIIVGVIRERERMGKDSPDFLLIDAIMDHDDDEAARVANTISYAVASFHTTGNSLTWCIYYLSLRDDVQEKLYQEMLDVLGPMDPLTNESIGQLKYLRQVLDETLRCSVLAPWGARISEQVTELGGHKIPAGTPVLHAFGVSLMDENMWPSPTSFDPERFSEERSKGRPNLAFVPFGFGGRRICPGSRFSYLVDSILMATLVRKFKFQPVSQHVVKHYGFVTHPREEIWIRLVKRE